MTKLELHFATRANKTFLKHQFVSSPLKVIRPFDLEAGRVLLQLVNVGPGIMAKDVFDINIKLEEGAKVVFINQSATKLHTMPLTEKAKQKLHIDVSDGAELEYYAGLSIPFKETAFEQSISVNLAQSAKFVFLERWAMGRIAFGERFLFQSLKSQMKLYQAKKMFYADALDLNSQSNKLGLTDDFAYLAAGVFVWDTLPEASSTEAIQNISLQHDSFTSAHFKDNAAYVRALAQDGLTLAKQINHFVNNWRETIGLEKLEFNRFGS